MQYALLIYEDEAEAKARPEAERNAEYGEYMTFTQRIHDQGSYRGGEALQPTSTATTVRVREGKTLTTDGPFAETREQLGGFFLVEAEDLDHAIVLAAAIPGARGGSIEVRPVLETPRPE